MAGAVLLKNIEFSALVAVIVHMCDGGGGHSYCLILSSDSKSCAACTASHTWPNFCENPAQILGALIYQNHFDTYSFFFHLPLELQVS